VSGTARGAGAAGCQQEKSARKVPDTGRDAAQVSGTGQNAAQMSGTGHG
jgi:hypothetical protein